jgi:hypothetical protein
MSEISPSAMSPEESDKLDNVIQFELREDENAVDPTILSHADIVGACISQSVFAVSYRSSQEVAGAVNRMLSVQRESDNSNKTRQAWHTETRARIVLAEKLVDENDMYEDAIVMAIVDTLHKTASQAEDFKEERAALRNLIDLRTVLLIDPEAITEKDDEKWTVLIDKLGPSL